MKQAPQAHESERAALLAAGSLLGRLLLREVDAHQLDRLREPVLATALDEWGIELPAPDRQQTWLEASAADYHELFLRPETGPLVQSLWSQGRYEGDATVRLRELAGLAGVEFQPAAARGAAVDHLGSILLLWSATEGRVPAVADEIRRAHLEWALPGLQRIASSAGFYGGVARASVALIKTLLATGRLSTWPTDL